MNIRPEPARSGSSSMRIGLPIAVAPRPKCVPVANPWGIRDDPTKVARAPKMAECAGEDSGTQQAIGVRRMLTSAAVNARLHKRMPQ